MHDEPNLYKLRECSRLGEKASIAGMDHASYAYHRWVRRHVEELLYKDLWIEPEEPPIDASERSETPRIWPL